MSTRKLQQEFDKTNKKIAEGLSVFDDIYDKLMTTEISSQKEKLESDLKKEIKKLQRSRDQLKQWLGDSSIKLDKILLQENRTKIEHAMDQFKDLEKSSKIKQFSNEGLELQSQMSKGGRFVDPENVKKSEACNYLSDAIDSLNQQNEALESEVHSASVQLKKSKSSNAYSIQSSIDDFRYKIEKNNTHLTKLEKILRSIENENMDPERIDDIKDDLEYYIENNQDDDYVEYDDFYEQLDIEADSLDVQGTLAQVTVNESNEKEEIEKEEVAEKTKHETPKREPSKVVKHESKAPVSAAPAASTISSKKTKPTVVPAPPPPPLTNVNSYSNVIKAAVQATSSPVIAPANTSTAASTPVKGPPPGLNNSGTPGANLSQVAPGTPDNDVSSLREQSQSPIFSNEDRTFRDTVPRLSSIARSRLHNPLPLQSISGLLELSLLNCPDSFDAEKPRQYNPLNVHPSSIDYPQEPMYELNSSYIVRKFDNDTLFFCFYYSEGIDNLAKYNAAKELSRRGWIYNTEFKQWFLKDNKSGAKSRSMSVIQKEEEQASQEAGSDEKEANYKYFDYEKTWLIRRKENYAFSKELREHF